MNQERVYELSSDVEFSKFNEKEYLLHNSKLNKYTKINSQYYRLLNLIDGERTVSEIQKLFQETNKIALTNHQIVLLFDQLESHGLFGESDWVEKRVEIPNYIKFGFIFLKPNIVSRIVPFLSFLFRKQVYIAILILGIAVFAINFYTNYTQFIELNVMKIMPYFLSLTFVSIILHELGHATAAHYYKAKHGGIGFGFYLYFMPVFFADVTDIWRLDRWKRMVVNGAGVYFEIVLCFGLWLIGIFIKNQTIQIVALIIATKALCNLLPFLRADGYWLLSDLFNKPNLNFHSMHCLKTGFISFFRTRKLVLKPKDYFIALYGLFNITIICVFFYYQLFLNLGAILSFPKTALGIAASIVHGTFQTNFNELTKTASVLIFYLILIKILIKLAKKLRN